MTPGERIPLARPDLGGREEALVLEVLRSGRLSLGPMLERFEGALAAAIGADETVGVGANIIEASWEALVDAVTYGLLRQGGTAIS